MSEKVTFGELIESIAEETDRSKQFTHDFLKDFADVVNGGLEQDGTVNIAGFGKFKLKRVDEREGYNPQTEEKITIPAHNKIVFKPYKDLRELVNAPYAHLEPELIEEDTDEEVVPTEEKSGQDDFIPTGPPTSKDSKNDEQEASSEDEAEEENDNGDIVEFDGEETPGDEDKIDDELNEFLGTENEPQEEQATDEQPDEVTEEEQTVAKDSNEEEQPETTEEESRFAPSEEEKTTTLDGKEESLAPAIGSTKEDGKQANSLPIFIAAVFILLVLVGGAWYFSLFSNGPDTSQQMAVNETSAVSQQADATADNNQQSTAVSNQDQNQDQQEGQSQKTQQNKQQATNTANQSAANSSTDQKPDAVNQTIEKGQTLWSLAEDNYGNPRLWPWIYGKNDALQNPDKILAGNSLSVPLPSGPQNNLNAADSVGVAKGFIATYQWYKGQNSSKAKNHLWGAKLYHNDIRSIADVEIDKADLAYANRAR